MIFCLGVDFTGGTDGEGDRKGEEMKSSKSSNEDDIGFKGFGGCWEKGGRFDDGGKKLESYCDVPN